MSIPQCLLNSGDSLQSATQRSQRCVDAFLRALSGSSPCSAAPWTSRGGTLPNGAFNLATAMEHAVNHDPFVFHLVQEAVGTHQQLPEARIGRIRVWPAPLAELLQ